MLARIAALEQEVRRLGESLAVARALHDDSRRLEQLADRAAQLGAAADTALLQLGDRARTAGVARPRSRPAIGTVHRAEVTGHVAIYFTGGRTNIIELLVGAENPPTTSVGELNVTNSLNAYASGIVRAGEYWLAKPEHGDLYGFRCVFTPLF